MDIYRERTRALELAIEFYNNRGRVALDEEVVFTAKKFYDFLTFNPAEQEDAASPQTLLDLVASCPVEFAKIIKIQSVDGQEEGVFPYNLDYIRQLHDNGRTVAASSRQLGSTTALAIYVLWLAMYSPNEFAVMLSSNYSHALDCMSRIRKIYETLPPEIKPSTTEYNKGGLKFENGSRIIARSVTPDSLRGLSPTLIAIDNAAFIPHSMGRMFMEQSYPVISRYARVIVQSGVNTNSGLFAEIWDAAVAGQNGFHSVQRLWNDDPRRTQAWKEEMMAMIGEKNFKRDYELQFTSEVR